MHGQFLARLCALAIGSLVPGVAPLPIREAVSAIAANDSGAVALTRDEVRVMDGSGFPVARFPRAGERLPAPHRRERRAGGFASAAGVLDDGDFNDPHDPDSEIEDPENIQVEDDAPAHRRPWAVGRSPGAALAVGGAFAWVSREDGLWRIPFPGNAERVALPVSGPVRAVATSADGRVVVEASGGGLAWSNDGGEQFERVAEAPARVIRLAVADDGRVYVLGSEGLHRLRTGAGIGDVIVRAAEDVVSCGNGALALAHHRILVLPGAGFRAPEELPATQAKGAKEEGPLVPLGAERLACGPDGKVWIAYGASLWTSDDQGQSWSPRDDLPAAAMISAVAVTSSSLWVASGAGLAVLPLRQGTVAELPSESVPSPDAAGIAVDVRLAPRWNWWLAALPRLDLGFATGRSNARREVRAFVLLSFTFDPGRAPRAERQLDADVRAAGLRNDAQRWLARDARVDRRLDPLTAEERAATLRLLDD